MGFSKSSSKRGVYNDTILPQETRKVLNRQPNSTSRAARKRTTTTTTKTQSQQKEVNHKDHSRNK